MAVIVGINISAKGEKNKIIQIKQNIKYDINVGKYVSIKVCNPAIAL